MSDIKRPIGVFDSGLGGLTVVRRLVDLLPHEDIVYFGDTARVPYGSRTDGAIVRYCRQDAAFLLSKDIKAMVVACATASSVAADSLRKDVGVPFFDMVSAAARAAEPYAEGRIAVLGTAATIRSHRHRELFSRLYPRMTVLEKACPLFVPLVENGHTSPGDPIVRETVKYYLDGFRDAGADALMLCCTHYPLLGEAIRAAEPWAALVDPAREAAEAVRGELEARGELNPGGGTLTVYTSDTSGSMKEFAAAALEGRKAEFGPEVDIETF